MNVRKVQITVENGRCVEAQSPVILSASRATDIPAFYMEWLINRLRKGYCVWKNPFNGIESYISLKDVRFIVFWSKNPASLIPYLSCLHDMGINCYVQYTLNDYFQESLEPGVPALATRIATFHKLHELLGDYGVVWR